MATPRFLGAALLVVLVAGCGSSAATKGAGTTTGVGEEACAPLEGGGTGGRSSPKPSRVMLLSGVAIATEVCAERITFDFRPDPAEKPGFRIEYRPAAEAQTEDGSGNHIAVDGSAFLVVRFEPAATADLSGDQLEFTYRGPRRVPAHGTRFVREVVKVGDFESVLTWTIGLGEKRPFKVTTSDSPPRLVVEIA
jgi:hypothetical protein